MGEGAVIVFPDDYDAAGGHGVRYIGIDSGSGGGDVYKITPVEAPDNSTVTDLDVAAGYGQSDTDISGLAISGSGDSARLLAGAAASGRTYFSDDGGASWTRSRRSPTGSSDTWVLTGEGGDKAYAATSGSESAFSVSEDGGRTWDQIGLVDTGMSSIVDMAPSPDYAEDGTLFMVTFGGTHSLWRSRDGGESWQRILNSSSSNVDSLDLVAVSPQYGRGSGVVFLAGSSHGRAAVWKSTDHGQNFSLRMTADPVTGNPFTVNAWAVVDDERIFAGSYDGSHGRLYRSDNGGMSYETGVNVGSQALTSIALSSDYAEDGNILAGNSNGWVYHSDDGGATFRPLPPDAGTAPLTGTISVAFDADFSRNGTVYATSSSADKGVYRFTLGSAGDWQSIDGTLPAGATLGKLIISSGGALYSANSQADGGMERSLNPAYPLGPSFDTVTRGLNDGAILSGLWQSGRRLWAIDTAGPRLMTFHDSLTVTVALTSPPDKAAGIGTPINEAVSNISLDWEPVSGATRYKWQLDYDTDFSSEPAGFEGTTRATSARLPDLTPAAGYFWRVRADSPVPGPWSEVRSFTTTLDTGLSTLELQNPKAGAEGVPSQPLFQWNPVPGAEAYELLVATDAEFTSPVIARAGAYALPTTAWQSNVSLDQDTIYYWKVRAINRSTYSAWSAVGAFKTESAANPQTPSAAPPPAVPTQPTPSVAPPPATPPPPEPTPAPLPPPPASPSAPSQVVPDRIMYIIGGLLVTIVLLVIMVMVMAMSPRHSSGR